MYLLLDKVFLRFAEYSSGSGELVGELTTLEDDSMDEEGSEETIDPKELFGSKVPFLGGRPIRFPVLDILGPLVGLKKNPNISWLISNKYNLVTLISYLVGPSCDLFDGEDKCFSDADELLVLACISILSDGNFRS